MGSVSNQGLLRPDPDSALQAKYRSGSRVLMTKNWKKFTAEFSSFSLSKIAIYLSVGPKRTPKLQKKPSALKREHPALLCVIFALLIPDPDSESGSTDLIESG